MITVTILASLHGTVVYRRHLHGYQSQDGLAIAIKNALTHAFKGFDCQVIR